MAASICLPCQTPGQENKQSKQQGWVGGKKENNCQDLF
jgi:hypothetical protein